MHRFPTASFTRTAILALAGASFPAYGVAQSAARAPLQTDGAAVVVAVATDAKLAWEGHAFGEANRLRLALDDGPALAIRSGYPQGTIVVMVDLSQTNVPIGGHHLMVTPLAQPLILRADGAGSVDARLPADPSLVNVPFYLQAFAFGGDCAGVPCLAFSNGLALRLRRTVDATPQPVLLR